MSPYPIRRETWDPAYWNRLHKRGFKRKIGIAISNYRIFAISFRAINSIFVKLPGILLHECLFLAKSLGIVRCLDILIISGGGQLLDSWGGPWKFPYTIFKWIILAKLSRLECYFINVGAGPLEHSLSKYFIRCALLLANYISFRDRK